MTGCKLETFESPLGVMLLVSSADGVIALEFEGFSERMHRLIGAAEFAIAPSPTGFRRRVEAYFTGDLGAVDDIPVHSVGTPFQTRVWQALRTIPPSRTITYGELAERIGKPTASRAVGHANSLNPVAIIQPCHRVIGAGGSLTGYAGGLERKHWLLRHEGALLA
jgi:O-6-methylguanine DNA methyltransferase